VVKQVLCYEFYWFFRLLLSKLSHGLKQQRHKLLVEIGFDRELFDFSNLEARIRVFVYLPQSGVV
jgi:hypothetical protein